MDLKYDSASGKPTSNDKTKNDKDEMRAEYDLSKLKGKTRGKYVDRYREDKSKCKFYS